jgi:hypothetical protein
MPCQNPAGRPGLHFAAVAEVDVIAAIKDELFRLRARSQDVGPVDAITVVDRDNGSAVLHGSTRRGDFFYWRGPATEILERLRGLPDQPEHGSGPEVIRSEFA